MAWAVVQQTHLATYASTQNPTIAFTANLASTQNVILVCVGTSAATIPTMTVTDNATGGTNTYTQALTATDSGTAARSSLFVAPIVNGVGTKPTVTVALNQASPFGTLITLMEVSGITSTLDVSVVKNNGAASAAPSVGPASATTAANEFCVALYCDGATATGTITVGSGWTDEGSLLTAGVDYSTEAKDSGASGSAVTANWTLSATNSGYCAVLGVFALAAPSAIMAPFIPRGMPVGV